MWEEYFCYKQYSSMQISDSLKKSEFMNLPSTTLPLCFDRKAAPQRLPGASKGVYIVNPLKSLDGRALNWQLQHTLQLQLQLKNFKHLWLEC